mgnify:CR=1 FL=1
MGGKPEPRSTQKGIEKRCKKEEQRDCQKSRNKNLQPRAPPRILSPGEGVGGGVNPSPREEGKGMTPVQRPKPPQPRGLVGFKKLFWSQESKKPIFTIFPDFLQEKIRNTGISSETTIPGISSETTETRLRAVPVNVISDY